MLYMLRHTHLYDNLITDDMINYNKFNNFIWKVMTIQFNPNPKYTTK